MKHDIKALMALNPHDLPPPKRKEVREILLRSILDIEVQLGEKSRTDKDGNKLSAKDYNEWRKKALTAKNHMTQRYREYKELRVPGESTALEYPQSLNAS